MGTSSKPFFRRARLVLLCTGGVLLVACFEPHLLRFGIKRGAIYKAAQHSVTLTIGKVEGSVFEPIVFHDVAIYSTKQGVYSETKARKATAKFQWRALILHAGTGFFQRLSLDGVESEVSFITREAQGRKGATEEDEKKAKRGLWLPIPSRLEVSNGNLAFFTGAGNLLATDVDCTLSGIEPGTIRIGKLKIDHGAFRKTFTNLEGTTGRQDTRLVFADLQLAPGVWLKSLASDAADPAGSVAFEFAAFGGAIRGELTNASRSQRPTYEINGNFYQISVPELAEFLDNAGKTGGTIKEGKFTFRGSPSAWEKATMSIRLEADDFLWGNRRWNSLVLGATIVNRRVEIPELKLRQAHNALSLKGELMLPPEGTPWWESDFQFDLAAKIDNLTDLSALFGPPFSDTAGKATVDGSIRGQKKNFTGQLLVAGSGLRYRNAPIEILNAGIKLEGNEVQILNFELANGTDFVRGKGVVNILGEKRYWGEINASVAELDAYRPLLEKPIAPVPLTGGVVVNWSGDGTLEAHSGAFTAKFRKLRTPGADGIPPTLPIDAELEGTYAPGSLFLTTCRLAHLDTRLETRLAAEALTLKFEELKLTQKNVLWLEGNAVLPVNLWQWWQSPGLAALSPTAPFKVGLTARGVQLDEVGQLTGRRIPFSGVISGPVSIEGTLRQVEMIGSLKLAKGRIPASGSLPALDDVEAEAELDGRIVRFSRFSARHTAGVFTGKGAVDFSQFESPTFELAIQSERIEFTLENGDWSGDAAVDLSVVGTRETAALNGSARLLSLKSATVPDFGPLISHLNGEPLRMAPPAFRLPAALLGWRFDVAVSTPEPVRLPRRNDGKAEAEVTLRFQTPQTASPFLPASGSVTYLRLPVKTEFVSATVETATIQWSSGEEAPSTPSLTARVAAKVAGTSFIGYYVGPVDRPAFTYVSEPAITQERLRLLLSEGFAPLPEEAGEFNPELAAPFNAPIPPPPAEIPEPSPEPPAADPPPQAVSAEETAPVL